MSNFPLIINFSGQINLTINCYVEFMQMPLHLDMNLTLRTEILEIALQLEQGVDSLLLVILSIDNEKRKSISNKSGNLSFKNKLDLLFDLDVLDSNEHAILLLMMEFRNQFLHNIKCSSFKIAVQLLGPDKKKRLLQFGDLSNNSDDEIQYKNAYKNLYSESLKIILDKTGKRKAELELRQTTYHCYLDSYAFLIDAYFNIIRKVLNICEENIIANPEVMGLADKIIQELEKDQELTFSSDEFAKIQDKFAKSHTPERIKKYFKR